MGSKFFFGRVLLTVSCIAMLVACGSEPSHVTNSPETQISAGTKESRDRPRELTSSGEHVQGTGTDKWKFVRGPNMKVARADHMMIPLEGGDALVLGGRISSGELAPPELYNAETNEFSLANGPREGRGEMRADGRISVNGYLVAEPSNTIWLGYLFVDDDKLLLRRKAMKLLLPNGQVLIAGGVIREKTVKGYVDRGLTNKAEIYDIRSKKSRFVGEMTSTYPSGSATLLKDGRVFFAGVGRELPTTSTSAKGVKNDGTEIFDPRTGSFTRGPNLARPRVWHGAVRLKDGRVLLIGGQSSTIDLEGLTNTSEMYDPKRNEIKACGPMQVNRVGPEAVLLSTGEVLVMDGSLVAPAQAELFQPDRNVFVSAGSLTEPRNFTAAALLSDGRVLICGGCIFRGFGSDKVQIDLAGSDLLVPKRVEIKSKQERG